MNRAGTHNDPFFPLFLIILFLSLLLLLNPSIRGNDGILNYVYLRSLFFDGDLDFSNEYREFDRISITNYQQDLHLSQKPSTGTGLLENRYGIGSSLLWFPFFLIAHLVCVLTSHIGSTVSGGGYSEPYGFAVALGSATYCSFGLLLLYRWLKKVFSPFAAFWSVVLGLFSTPLVFYAFLHPSMSHANSFFLVSLFLFLYLEKKPSHDLARWTLLGAVASLLVMTRFQDATFLLVPVVGEIVSIIRKPVTQEPGSTRRFLPYGLFLCSFFVVFIPQLLVWKTFYGSYLSGPAPYLGYTGFNIFFPRHLFQVLFSSNHGVLFWHPWLILGLGGLFLKSVLSSRTRVLLLVGFLGVLYLVSCWEVWWAGASFGHRMFVSSLPVFIIGFAAFLTAARRKLPILVVPAAVVFLSLWNFGLIVQYAFEVVPRQPRDGESTLSVSLGEVAANQVTKVPKLVFDKSLRYFSRRDRIESE